MGILREKLIYKKESETRNIGQNVIELLQMVLNMPYLYLCYHGHLYK
jgi:hypothetical protein